MSVDSYVYDDADWGDLLTSYNGIDITYDAIGNPLNYYNGSNYTFTWSGRRLTSATKDGVTYSYTYNDEGIRTSKTVGDVTTYYLYSGSLLISEYTDTETIIYIYDANGSPLGFKYRLSTYAEDAWDTYWYEKNMQGDIVAIYSENGTKLVSYVYDAWGNTSISYSNGGASTTAVNNRLTYRGYYYDADTGFYYLQSRYYDPTICRFISPDAVSYLGANEDLVSYNLYAYCSNNPVNYTDPTGKFLNCIIGAIVGLMVNSAVAIVAQLLDDEASNISELDFWKHVLVAGGIGAVSGAVAASSPGIWVQVATNGVLGMIGALADTYIDDTGDTPWYEYAMNGIDGAILGVISGYIGGRGSASKHTSNSFKRFIDGKSNFRYYFSQVKTQSFSDGIRAIPSIIKASTPYILKMWLTYSYQRDQKG